MSLELSINPMPFPGCAQSEQATSDTYFRRVQATTHWQIAAAVHCQRRLCFVIAQLHTGQDQRPVRGARRGS
jgi:hypothetical protein